jgi:phosphatidylserine decarboxylase
MTVARDGLREILISTALGGVGGGAGVWAAIAVSSWYWLAAVPLLAAWLSVVVFFRDPSRQIPNGTGLLVSPADGRVTEITRLERHEGIEGPAIRIGIFLSIFDVHINRAPCAGRVLKTAYRPGEFLDARHPESGLRNEANTIVIEPDAGMAGPVVVRQIAGLIARRIVCRVGAGDRVERGQRVGLIKFGSRTELIVPADCGLEAVVRLNDHVKGGATVLMGPISGPSSPASRAVLGPGQAKRAQPVTEVMTEHRSRAETR